MAQVALEHVTQIYRHRRRQVQALNDLSLTVGDGELMVVVGSSGCGKTTALRLVAGLEEPTSGTIHIDRRTMNRVAPRDRDVAMVFQNHALYPHMTVYDNVAFGLKMRKTPRPDIARRVDEVAEMLGISQLLQRRPGELSGGEQQRVAVGRAIARRPRVFLLDEPLSNLDAGLRLRMRAELKALHRDLRTTTIHVTHDQEEAMTLGERLAVMRDGRLEQVGPPMEVYDRPATHFVAEFIGTPPMNFVEGRVEADAGGGAVTTAIGAIVFPEAVVASLQGHRGRTVVLGVRPQHVALARCHDDGGRGTPPIRKGRDDAGCCRGTVALVEPLGDCTDVHVRLANGLTWVARVCSREQFAPGQAVVASFDAAALHVLAAEGRRERLN